MPETETGTGHGPARTKVKIPAIALLLAGLCAACTFPRVDEQMPASVTQVPAAADILQEQFSSSEQATAAATATSIPGISASPATAPPSFTPSVAAATATPTLRPPIATETKQPLPTAATTAVPQVWIELNAVYLRRGPGIHYPVTRLLFNGDVVEVIAVFGGVHGWYNVRLSEGLTGWVSTSVVKPVASFSVTLIPTAATIPATITPSPTPTATATNTPVPRPPRPTQPPLPATATQPPMITPTVNPYPW